MLEAYIERRVSPQLFLSSFFRTSPRSFHNSEHVEVDIRRGEPYLAIPVQSVTSGARKHEVSLYTNKKFTPPVYDLEVSISAWSTSQRQPGITPFQDVNFRQAATDEAFRSLNELEDMLRRAVELQASQIFQTGVVTLTDAASATIYTLDFQARPSHFVITTPWAADGSTGDPLGDIESMGIKIRRDGKMNATDLVLGTSAMQRLLANDEVKARFDNRGLVALTEIRPVSRPDGATFYGTVVVGHYRYNLWMYDGYFIDPATLEPTPYVGDTNVIMLAEQGRRDLTFGSIPMFMPPDARAAQFLPARMSSVEQGFDLTTNIWVSPDGKHLHMSAGTRPLCVPTALDTFGTLTVA
jgi:hypothetical protein